MGSLLLQWMLEHIGGRGLGDLVQTRVIDPMGLAGDVFCGFDRASFGANRARIGVDAVLLDRPVPCLLASSARAALDVRASLSVYATMRGMATRYARLGSALAGVSSTVPQEMVPMLPQLVRSGPPAHDPVRRRRRCSFGRGFMTDLTNHSFGSDLSAASFGHSGYAATTSAFHDPDARLTVAVHWNAVIDPTLAAFTRRPVLVDHLVATMTTARRDRRGS